MAKKNIKKYTKQDIESIVEHIKKRLTEVEADHDVAIYYNGKRVRSIYHWNEDKTERVHDWVLEEGEYYPIDYCEYAPNDNIICISSEGDLYDAMNYISFTYMDDNILPPGCDLYTEMGTTWFYILCPNASDWKDWETTRKPGDYRHITV